MKLTCTQENLSRGLGIVSRLGEKNTNLPILSNVLLEARKDGLLLSATNLEIGIKTRVRGKIDTEGSFTVNARLMADFVNSLHKENISISVTENELNIEGENHQTTIRGLDASDFPVIPEVGEEFVITVKSEDLAGALAHIVFAMSADETRPELHGALFQFKQSECVAVATDSYRLSERRFAINNKSGSSKSVIVPARTLTEVQRILENIEPHTVSIKLNDNQVLFVLGESEVVSRIVNGAYPDYQQIIPSSFKNEVAFSVSDMIRAVKTTALFCKQGINDVRIALDKRFTDITIQAENNTFGKNISHVKSITPKQEMDVVFNYKFLLDGLQRLSHSTAVLKTNEPTTPVVLSAEKGDEFLYVIMPIRQ